ncbi:anti-sigma factor family protein [Pseudactinotalea suaedae]|uniref:anti-sigma factor family protein n=1 Tax=Pseudactinotalea suaedae TaxID=1524924 RepID=UPI0012E1E0C4|nr:zf-HC2 domain-containing protein [Pseudactinotalea suaedae]
MSHLGALITPYVDGELSPARAAEARAHLSVCGECRSVLAMEQAARRRTQNSARSLQASAELTARLLAMPAGPVPLGAEPRRSRLAPFVLGGGVTLVGLFVLTLVVLGGPRPDQHPSALLAATDAPAADITDTATTPVATRPGSAQASTAGWALPANHTVNRLDLLDDGGTETLDVVVDTAAGEVRLLERVGTLDERVTSLVDSLRIGDHTAYLVDGWYVLESGPCVVAVLAESEAAAEAVIAQLPAPSPDGILGRMVDGWHVLVG